MSRRKLAEKIKDDVIDWSKNVLEPMNKHLGYPACPFAAKWRKDGKLRIEVRSDKSKYEKHLTTLLKDWNKKKHDIIIFCDPFWEQYTPEQFQDKIDFYNKTYNRRTIQNTREDGRPHCPARIFGEGNRTLLSLKGSKIK